MAFIPALWQVPMQRENMCLAETLLCSKTYCFDLLFDCCIVHLNTEILVSENAAEQIDLVSSF